MAHNNSVRRCSLTGTHIISYISYNLHICLDWTAHNQHQTLHRRLGAGRLLGVRRGRATLGQEAWITHAGDVNDVDGMAQLVYYSYYRSLNHHNKIYLTC
jgi:hypothetical protein